MIPRAAGTSLVHLLQEQLLRAATLQEVGLARSSHSELVDSKNSAVGEYCKVCL